MSRQFDAAVDVALEIERELRALSSDKLSIRGWVSACLSRGELVYEDIEAVKERLGSDFLHTRMVDSGAYCRDLRKYIAGGSLKEPPAADKIQRMYFAQRDGAIAELGAKPKMLFTLVAIVAEQVYQERPEFFGGIDDIDAHKARIAELEAKRKELYARFPSTWAHGDLHIGRITSDGAALITFAKAQARCRHIRSRPRGKGLSSTCCGRSTRPRLRRLRTWAAVTESSSAAMFAGKRDESGIGCGLPEVATPLVLRPHDAESSMLFLGNDGYRFSVRAPHMPPTRIPQMRIGLGLCPSITHPPRRSPYQ